MADLPITMQAQHPLCKLERTDECFNRSPSRDLHRDVWERIERYDRDIGEAVDDLYDIQQILQKDGRFAESDRLRIIMGKLARARRNDVPLKEGKKPGSYKDDLRLTRHMCLKW